MTVSAAAAVVVVVGLREVSGLVQWSTVRSLLPSGTGSGPTDPSDGDSGARDGATGPPRIAPREFLLSTLTSHGVWTVTLLAVAVLAGLDPAVLGIPPAVRGAAVVGTLLVGLGLGLAMYALTEVTIAAVRLAGLAYDEGMRTAAAPDSVGGWVLLGGVTLPLVSLGEELLFRAVLVGAAGALVGPTWAVALASTVAFALIHTTGSGGIVVAGVLGAVLAAAFVATGSLLVVVVAHTAVNLLEFVVHEGLGAHPDERLVGAVEG